MAYRVRRIRPDEGALLRATRLRALAEAPEAFGSAYGEQVDRPARVWENQARETSEDPRHAIFFAEGDEDNGGVVGMVRGYAEPGEEVTCDLASMWVAPEARGSGAAAGLVAAVLRWAGEHGFERVVLWVTEENVRAQRLYASCGFEFTGERQPLREGRHQVVLEMARAAGE